MLFQAFNALATVVKEYGKIGYSMVDSRIIDINKVEVSHSLFPARNISVFCHIFLQLVTGKMMEQGPVLIITFQAFMLYVVKNSEGRIVDGDPVGLPQFLFFLLAFDVFASVIVLTRFLVLKKLLICHFFL